MTFFFSWNELFFALIFCGNRTKTAPLTIMEFMGYRTFDWGAILAAGVILMARRCWWASSSSATWSAA